MAIFLRFQSHCPYEGSASEEPGLALVALVNAAHVEALVWPVPQTAQDAEQRYWQSTQLGFALSTGVVLEALGFDDKSAARVSTVFAGLARRKAGLPSSLICAVPGFARGEPATYIQSTHEAPLVTDCPLPLLEARLRREGHLLIDLSNYQDFSHRRAPAP